MPNRYQIRVQVLEAEGDKSEVVYEFFVWMPQPAGNILNTLCQLGCSPDDIRAVSDKIAETDR